MKERLLNKGHWNPANWQRIHSTPHQPLLKSIGKPERHSKGQKSKIPLNLIMR
ncbi:Hypothetical protein FKW44_011330 [Caligus rogercresseyi]|uniref:Uncharacterized protein n=1 Tax=Caligus rogercresseyi TaxID=217165 RepID=A0A7T8HI70_CALRO|nr:Hypothetical protein FKW44_011330 [Caligus rogercresseyi]